MTQTLTATPSGLTVSSRIEDRLNRGELTQEQVDDFRDFLSEVDREFFRHRLPIRELGEGLAVVALVERGVAHRQGRRLRLVVDDVDDALALADVVGLAAGERDVLRRGGLLHDIGKISVPDAILNKPGPLTPVETAVMQQHPEQGMKIIEPLESLRDTIPLIRWHHERLDGKGYPDGLEGEQIPKLVRILSVADVYDSLSSERPYRGPIPHERCLQMLREDAVGGGLDLDLVVVFSEVVTPLAGAVLPTTQFPLLLPASAGLSRH